MAETERIADVKNSVEKGLQYGKVRPQVLTTNENSVYRVTGMDQVQDIIECGYVRPKGYGARRERVGDIIYWSIGGEGIYYFDKRPVLESSTEKVKNGQLGAIPLEDLIGIWIFNDEQNKYVNNIEAVKHMYNQLHPTVEEYISERTK